MDYVNSVNKSSFMFENKRIHIMQKNSQKFEVMGKKVGIVYHHTGGDYMLPYDYYHFNVMWDGKKPIVVKTLGLDQKGQHLYGRNTGMIGITFDSLSAPALVPTPNQLDAGALLGAELCCWQNIDPEAKLILPKKKYNPRTNTLDTLSGTIEAPTISDHNFFGCKERDDYGRWDIGDKYPIVVKALNKYYKELKQGKRKFVFEELIK